MKWEGDQESSNVEDKRGMGSTLAYGGGIGSVVLVILALVLGVDPRQLLGPGNNNPQNPAAQHVPAGQDEAKKFVGVVLKYTEDTWTDEFAKMGKTYRKPKLDIFSNHVNSACGNADAAVGPFYCPGDEKVYIDLTFFEEMEKKLNAPGEFARAYVIAHEVGHHVQHLLGYTARGQDNDGSVRLELQADYLAGVCLGLANKKHSFLEPRDLDSALNAAIQIGDDTLQKRAAGRVMPEKFTHGTSAQRNKYFRDGFESMDDSKRKLDHFFSVESSRDL